MNPQWNMCSKGRRQSPINIEPDKLLFDPYLRLIHVDKHKVSNTWTRSKQLSSQVLNFLYFINIFKNFFWIRLIPVLNEEYRTERSFKTLWSINKLFFIHFCLSMLFYLAAVTVLPAIVRFQIKTFRRKSPPRRNFDAIRHKSIIISYQCSDKQLPRTELINQHVANRQSTKILSRASPDYGICFQSTNATSIESIGSGKLWL